MKKKAVIVTIVLGSMLASGCIPCRTKTEETMWPLASAMTHLSSQVEALVRYGAPPARATDDELLKLATKNDPSFLETFAGYRLRVQSSDRHAIVLLCSKDGKRALLEDLGCTAQLDRNLWKEDGEMPCEFTLSVELGCGSFNVDKSIK